MSNMSKKAAGFGVGLIVLAALIFAIIGVGYTLFGDSWEAESNRHAYEEGYEKGLEDGYDEGYKWGYREGYDCGYHTATP